MNSLTPPTIPGYQVVLALKAACACLGSLVLLWIWWAERQGHRRHWTRDAALAAVAVASAAGWWNFGQFHFAGGYVHYHEFFHYFLGSKYFNELGYTGLYECVAVAELEAGRGDEVAGRWTRDLLTNELQHGSPALADPDRCLSRFASPDRWQQFKNDAWWFHDHLDPIKWREILGDHGYNATPVWTAEGLLLAGDAPASFAHIWRLALIDPLLLLITFALIWWAFGWRVLAVAVLWWGTNYPSRYTYIGGAFLRQDWLLLSTAALCFAKRGWMAASGFSLTWAALLRVFPGFMAIGLLLQAITAMWKRKSLRVLVEYRRFAIGCCAALALLVPSSIAIVRGPEGGVRAWHAFAQNSRKHLATPLTNNIGLPMLLSFEPSSRGQNIGQFWLDAPWDTWKWARMRAFDRRRWLFVTIVAVYLGLLAAAVRDRPVWLAVGLSLGAIPFLTNLAGYYYGFLLEYATLWVVSPLNGLALAVTSAATCAVPIVLRNDDDRSMMISLLVVVYALGVTVSMILQRRRATRDVRGTELVTSSKDYAVARRFVKREALVVSRKQAVTIAWQRRTRAWFERTIGAM